MEPLPAAAAGMAAISEPATIAAVIIPLIKAFLKIDSFN
jgi:hypothetical protein